MATWEKILRRSKRLLKPVLFRLNSGPKTAQPIFVMGYGRSGTTMLLDAFEHDMRIEVLGENDPRVAENYILLPAKVAPTISASRAAAIVMKPILDSFNVRELLVAHPRARVIWAFRHFDPVISSAVKMFGSRVADELRDLVVYGTGNGWLARGVPGETLEILRGLDSSEFGTNDWMALVWWSVNRTLLSADIANHDRLLLVQYEDLVRDPSTSMERLYDFMGLRYRESAGEWIKSPATPNKGQSVPLLPPIRCMCEELITHIHDQWECTKEDRRAANS
jgi:hypothetical protein